MKVMRPCFSEALAHSMLERECAVATILHDHYQNAPRPIRVAYKRFMDEEGVVKQQCGYFMERIDGVSGSMIDETYDDEMKSSIDALFRHELELANRFFEPWDYEGNFIYMPKRDKVLLIDFPNWIWRR